VVANLGIGIGLATATWSYVDDVLLGPLPGVRPAELVEVSTYSPKDSEATDSSLQDYEDLREAGREGILDLAAYFSVPFNARVGKTAIRLEGQVVSDNYFEVLSVPMLAGRAFSSRVRQAGMAVVVSSALWERQIAPNGGNLGDAITINGSPFTVIGVAPPGFHGVGVDVGHPTDVWIDLRGMAQAMPGWTPAFTDRSARWLRMFGRLLGDTPPSAASERLASTSRHLGQAFPTTNEGLSTLVRPGYFAKLPRAVRESAEQSARALGTIAFLALAIGCFNALSLYILSLHRRSRDFSVMLCLGATPAHLSLTLAKEVAFLFGVAYAVGLGGIGLLRWLLQLFPQLIGNPLGDSSLIRPRVLAVSFVALLAILPPFLAAVRAVFARGLAPFGVSPHLARRGRQPSAQVGVALQLGLVTALLVSAVQNTANLLSDLSRDLGFASDVFTASLDLNALPGRYDEAHSRELYASILEKVKQTPGVTNAAWGAAPPLGSRILKVAVNTSNDVSVPSSAWWTLDGDIVGPGYFNTLGIPLVEGREFSDRDVSGQPAVAIVNETMSRQIAGTIAGDSKRLAIRGRERTLADLVGVVRDSRYHALTDRGRPFVYLPLGQRYFAEMTLFVRASRGDLAEQIRSIVERLDPDLPVFDLQTLEARRKGRLSQGYLAAAAAVSAAVCALALGLIGVYALAAQTGAHRTHEFAVRIALGATPRRVGWEEIRRDALWVILGISAGALCSYLVSSYGQGAQHPSGQWQLSLPIGVGVFVGAAAAWGSYMGLRPAIRRNPADTLRHE